MSLFRSGVVGALLGAFVSGLCAGAESTEVNTLLSSALLFGFGGVCVEGFPRLFSFVSSLLFQGNTVSKCVHVGFGADKELEKPGGEDSKSSAAIRNGDEAPETARDRFKTDFTKEDKDELTKLHTAYGQVQVPWNRIRDYEEFPDAPTDLDDETKAYIIRLAKEKKGADNIYRRMFPKARGRSASPSAAADGAAAAAEPE